MVARASEGTLNINLNSLKTILNAMPGLEKSLVEAGTEYSKSQHAQQAAAAISAQVDAGLNSKASVDALVERVGKQLDEGSLVVKGNPSADGPAKGKFAQGVADSRNGASERTR